METGYIYINDNVFSTLLAISRDEQSVGLMGQEWPPPIMSFIYDKPRINKFWMNNTPSPLDIVFCNNGKVSQICYGEPYSTKTIGDDNFSDLIIELPYGTIESVGIKIGHTVGIVSPTNSLLQKIIAQKCGHFVKF